MAKRLKTEIQPELFAAPEKEAVSETETIKKKEGLREMSIRLCKEAFKQKQDEINKRS